MRLLRKPISSQLAQWSLVCEYWCEENTTKADFDAEALAGSMIPTTFNYLCAQEVGPETTPIVFIYYL